MYLCIYASNVIFIELLIVTVYAIYKYLSLGDWSIWVGIINISIENIQPRYLTVEHETDLWVLTLSGGGPLLYGGHCPQAGEGAVWHQEPREQII